MSFWKRWIGNYKRFGKLTVLKKSEEKGKKGVMWECLCDYGNKCLKPAGVLTSGFAKSYGCVWRTSTVVAVVGSSADHLASFLFLSDIYLFVGLFYLLLGLFRKAKIPMADITVISLLMLTVNCIFSGLAKTGSETVNAIIGNIVYLVTF